MILSHEHRFVFIKGLKVAGTSAEIALSQLCGRRDIITPITPADERYRLCTAGEPRNYAADASVERDYLEAVRSTPTEKLADLRHPKTPFTNHMHLAEVLALVPEARDYRLIFVERSPYAKVLSFANWERHQRAYSQGDVLARSADGVAEMVDRIIENGRIRNVRNIERYRDLDGRIRGVQWSYANLAQHVVEFCAERGLRDVALVHAKRGFGSESVEIAAVLRPDQIDYINELFADEFEAFGFPVIASARRAANS